MGDGPGLAPFIADGNLRVPFPDRLERGPGDPEVIGDLVLVQQRGEGLDLAVSVIRDFGTDGRLS